MEVGKINIDLDKEWELRDFSTMTKEYGQLYSVFYVLQSVSEDYYLGLDFSRYPWGGGYSVVNFFQRSYSLTPPDHRLQITKIQYASPGFVELSGVLGIAVDVSILISTLCGSALALSRTYNSIIKAYHERRLGKIKIKEAESRLIRDDIEFIHQSVRTLSNDYKLKPEHIRALKKITNGNELVQLKILLALYRRAYPIVEQQKDGKTKV